MWGRRRSNPPQTLESFVANAGAPLTCEPVAYRSREVEIEPYVDPWGDTISTKRVRDEKPTAIGPRRPVIVEGMWGKSYHKDLGDPTMIDGARYYIGDEEFSTVDFRTAVISSGRDKVIITLRWSE